MLLIKTVLLIYFVNWSAGNLVPVTFKNVVFYGYEFFTPKFRPTILSGNNLKEYLPNNQFDTIEFVDQYIPVLYENSITDIDVLTDLIIETSNVREIRPGAFKNLPKLNKLSLKGNQLETIENRVFNELPIHSLDLSHNKINIIYPQAFDNMKHLFYINLAYNNIGNWNREWFKNTPELSTIFIKNNFIKKLWSNSFKNLKSVRELNLVFSNNQITNIHSRALEDLRRIALLNLSNNLLTNFDKNIVKDTIIDDLRLNNNSITCFDKDDLDIIFKGKSIYIEFNPLDCDCVQDIQKWTKNHNKDVGINDVKCPKKEIDTVIDIDEFNLADNTQKVRISLVLPRD